MKNQEIIDRLFSMLQYIAAKEDRTDEDQMYIDTLIQVLNDIEGKKPDLFDLFF